MRQTLTKVLQKNKSTLFIRPILNIKYAKILWNSVNKVFCVIGTGISLMAIDQQRHIHSQMYIRNSFEVTILLQSPECFFLFCFACCTLEKKVMEGTQSSWVRTSFNQNNEQFTIILKTHLFSCTAVFFRTPLFGCPVCHNKIMPKAYIQLLKCHQIKINQMKLRMGW